LSFVWSIFQDVANSHVVGKSDLPLLVANDGEAEPGARDLVDVLDPATVALNSVCTQADELGVPLGELGLKLGEGAELGGADGGVVLGVREEDDPVVANELVEVDGTTGGLSLEVGGGAAEAEGLRTVGHFGGCVVLLVELAAKTSLVSYQGRNDQVLRQEQVSLTSWVVQLQVRRREIMNQEGAISKKYVCRVNKRVQHAIRRMDDGGVLGRPRDQTPTCPQ
jgi:hypothetical protein